jgi:DNA processing protein
MSSPVLSPLNSTLQPAVYWLALALTPRLGPTRVRKLVEHFGSAERVFQVSLTELEASGMPVVSAQSLATGESMELALQEIAKAVACDAKIIALDDPSYPRNLKEIYDPPVVLFVRGSVEVLSLPGIAMVGTRHPTPYGQGMAERLSKDLAARGLVIISGMARGVDTASHRGAIAAGGKTVAVFGTGVDVLYPKENSRLAEQILSLGGALISEFPIGTFAAPQNFPIRNRIIAGISSGVVVVEASRRSGSLITARLAADFGRDVFAVPGSVFSPTSIGTHELLRDGAILCRGAEDVLAELFPSIGAPLSAAAVPSAVEISPEARRILDALVRDDELSAEELARSLDLPAATVLAALFELEGAGIAVAAGGGRYGVKR